MTGCDEFALTHSVFRTRKYPTDAKEEVLDALDRNSVKVFLVRVVISFLVPKVFRDIWNFPWKILLTLKFNKCDWSLRVRKGFWQIFQIVNDARVLCDSDPLQSWIRASWSTLDSGSVLLSLPAWSGFGGNRDMRWMILQLVPKCGKESGSRRASQSLDVDFPSNMKIHFGSQSDFYSCVQLLRRDCRVSVPLSGYCFAISCFLYRINQRRFRSLLILTRPESRIIRMLAGLNGLCE